MAVSPENHRCFKVPKRSAYKFKAKTLDINKVNFKHLSDKGNLLTAASSRVIRISCGQFCQAL